LQLLGYEKRFHTAWARSRHAQRTARVRKGQRWKSFQGLLRWQMVIGDHVTGFLIIAAVGAASGLIQISSDEAKPTAAR
jgi:hypothetical protein